jgi:hypothetical protein
VTDAQKADAHWIKARVADELGLTESDLARLYSLEESALDAYLGSLAADPNDGVSRVLADLDTIRVQHRKMSLNTEQIESIRELVGSYLFHPLISLPAASGNLAWRLSGDDAQWVAFRAADLLNIDFNASDVLRLRLNRLVVFNSDDAPPVDEVFCDHLAHITCYLAELSGVL